MNGLRSPYPADPNNSFHAGQLFIKQLEALQRARLLGTHQNTSINRTSVLLKNLRVKKNDGMHKHNNRGGSARLLLD